MEFNIKKRDGPARIGELKVNAEKIITPNILFINPLVTPPKKNAYITFWIMKNWDTKVW